MKTVLDMKKISIAFPGVQALNGVDFRAETGRVHALIGANGAGKSTLMKILSGAYGHYEGNLLLNGEQVEIRQPADAKKHGIQMVYQEVDTALIPNLSVGENIMMDQLVNGADKQWIEWKRLWSEAEALLKKLNIPLSPKKPVSDLTLAEKQMVLIARAISNDCRFLILDEPTAPLSQTETDELFRVVRDLKQQHVSIIFISHRLPELFAICDDITVMRNGELVGKKQIAETTQNDVIEMMLGRKMDEQFPARKHQKGDVLLRVSGLTARDVHGVDLTVHAGEVVGLTGLVGAGKSEINKALFGEDQHTSGTVEINGQPVSFRSPHDAVKKGLVLVPEERRREGVFVSESVLANLTVTTLGALAKRSFISFRKEKETAAAMIERLDVRTPSAQTKVRYLSGGNQQKIAIGKWLLAEADVYLFDEPTKGVDVGAKREIFDLIAELAARGKGVLYTSSEMPEIFGMTDRMYVVYDGRIAAEKETAHTTEEEVMYYSTGGN
ncbi:sugar ABC transporter ATP-binding protein [Domibacillus enclensis]|uniref:Monosaccharide ABC transporter ATP-binding protein, CUT2 family n=3 Tax=Domibacillus enclensis TaxID=1017273 RepID=A0A1N6YXW8_9BACI|nr:sugar ABC transporter ATP-binding protein [Domibacillus enclensis]SIR19410.1 monosaccharide ABC transporter ATP-binding protein, CUT2 family [Domibacillus enclensis]